MLDYFHNNFEKMRWLLLLIFVIGYVITLERFSYIASDYLIYSVLAVSSCVVLLSQIKSYGTYYSAIWLTLGVFLVVYFVRFYWIAVDPLPVKTMLHTPVYNNMIQDAALFQGFRVSVISFIMLSVSISIMIFFSRDRKDNLVNQRGAITSFDWFNIKALIIFLPVLMLALAFISHKYHIGEMGADSGEPLPFRLKGVIFYARFIMLPLLIIFLIYLSERSGHKIVARFGVLFLLSHGVIDMLLRGSRSGLLLSALLLVFLVMSGGLKLHRNEKFLAVFVLIVGLFMVPIMTEYRAYRVVEHLPVVEAILTSISAIGNEWWGTLLSGIEFVLFRMPGIEAVSAIIGMDTVPLGMHAGEVFQSKQGVAGYLTHDVYLITRDANTLAAPGFIGWFYLVAGVPAAAIGSVMFAVIVVMGWRLLNDKYFICLPVARTFFLWMLFHALTEGTLDSMLYMLVVGMLTIFMIEFFMRVGGNVLYPRFSRT